MGSLATSPHVGSPRSSSRPAPSPLAASSSSRSATPTSSTRPRPPLNPRVWGRARVGSCSQSHLRASGVSTPCSLNPCPSEGSQHLDVSCPSFLLRASTFPYPFRNEDNQWKEHNIRVLGDLVRCTATGTCSYAFLLIIRHCSQPPWTELAHRPSLRLLVGTLASASRMSLCSPTRTTSGLTLACLVGSVSGVSS